MSVQICKDLSERNDTEHSWLLHALGLMHKRKYSRNGCAECKRRKIKCGEESPKCGYCTKTGKLCVYNQLKFKGASPKHKSAFMHEKPDLLDEASSIIAELNELIALEMPENQGFSPSIDNLTPYYPTQVVSDDYLESLLSFNEDSWKSLASYFGFDQSSVHSTYLSYLVTEVQPFFFPLTPSLSNSRMTRVLFRQAKDHDFLLNAMLASSADYYFMKTNDQRHAGMYSYYLSLCFKSLGAILSQKDEILANVESTLLTTLVLAAVFSSSKGDHWRSHLRGAKELLLKYIQQVEMSEELALAKLWFATMEMLASLILPAGGTASGILEIQSLLCIKSENMGRVFESLQLTVDGVRCDKNGSETICPNALNLFSGFGDPVIDLFRETMVAFETVRLSHEYPENLYIVGEKLHLTSSTLCRLFSLVDGARELYLATRLPPFVIAADNPCHPQFDGPRKRSIPLSALTKISHKGLLALNGGVVFYSMYDLIQSLQVDAVCLRILVGEPGCALPVNHFWVQETVNRAIGSLESLIMLKADLSESDLQDLQHHYTSSDETVEKPRLASMKFGVMTSLEHSFDFSRYVEFQLDFRLLMIHWALLIVGFCCIEPVKKVVIDCLLNALIGMGVGSASFSLDRLRKIWKLQMEKGLDEKIDFFSTGDSVPYC